MLVLMSRNTIKKKVNKYDDKWLLCNKNIEGLGSLTGFFGPVFCQKSKKTLAVLPVIFSFI